MTFGQLVTNEDDIAELAADAAAVIPSAGRGILGLVGPPGSGKSTLARRLVRHVNLRYGHGIAAYVPLDGFHLSNVQLEHLGYRSRKGAVFTFDVWGYVALLRRLLVEMDHPIYVADYDRDLHEPVGARHVVEPRARLVITEGNYLASTMPGWNEIADVVAQLWYVEAAADLRESRLMRRHSRNGGEDTARWRVTYNDRVNAAAVEQDRQRCHRTVSVLHTDA